MSTLQVTSGLREIAKRRGPCRDVLIALRDAGWTQRRVGKLLGMKQASISSRCRRLGIDWPDNRQHRIRVNDQLVSLPEAAAITGINYTTIYYRKHILGWPDEKIIQPVHSVPRSAPRRYALGLSMADWRVLLDAVEHEAATAANRVRARYRVASRHKVPYGAIAAADRGEWERLE